jgi:hypothetical protein
VERKTSFHVADGEAPFLDPLHRDSMLETHPIKPVLHEVFDHLIGSCPGTGPAEVPTFPKRRSFGPVEALRTDLRGIRRHLFLPWLRVSGSLPSCHRPQTGPDSRLDPGRIRGSLRVRPFHDLANTTLPSLQPTHGCHTFIPPPAALLARPSHQVRISLFVEVSWQGTCAA